MTAYRNEAFSRLLAFVTILSALGSIVLAATSTEATGMTRWAPAAAVVALATFCWFRLVRAGVYADDEGIRIVNPLRTWRLPWSRVEAFRLRRGKGFPALGFALLDDGTDVEIWAIQARNSRPQSRQIPEKLIEDLNQRLRESRG